MTQLWPRLAQIRAALIDVGLRRHRPEPKRRRIKATHPLARIVEQDSPLF
jgi:hypothetical protein